MFSTEFLHQIRESELEFYRGYLPAGARVLDKVRSLSGSIGRAAYPPTAAQANWTAQVRAELDGLLGLVDEVLLVRLPALNRQMNEAQVPRIIGGF